MALKTYGVFTPSVRHAVGVDRSGLWKGKPEKSLLACCSFHAGRNNQGRITSRGRGGGVKRRYRIIDFKRFKNDVGAVVERIEYDPNRTAFIALLRYDDGDLSYILAPSKLVVGQDVMSGVKTEIKIGNAMYICNMPVGTLVHNVELKPGAGGQLARAAGTYAQVISRESRFVLLRLSSGEVRRVQATCMATVGTVSNPDNQNVYIGRAGRNRLLGKRPTVRGVAMNPVDHPHGGGEGKTGCGRQPVTPWGLLTKGKRTRKNMRTGTFIVSSRHSKGR